MRIEKRKVLGWCYVFEDERTCPGAVQTEAKRQDVLRFCWELEKADDSHADVNRLRANMNSALSCHPQRAADEKGTTALNNICTSFALRQIDLRHE